jgi:hypothetical protein
MRDPKGAVCLLVLFAALAVVCLTGCAPLRPPSCTVGNPTICYGSAMAIDRECRQIKLADDDTYYPRGYLVCGSNLCKYYVINLDGCYIDKTKTVYLRWGASKALVAHERCHAEGRPRAYCEKAYPAQGSLY